MQQRFLFLEQLDGNCHAFCLIAQSCPTHCYLMDCSPPGSSVHGDSPVKNTGVSCHALLPGIFLTQGLNPGLLNCRWILYCLTYPEIAICHSNEDLGLFRLIFRVVLGSLLNWVEDRKIFFMSPAPSMRSIPYYPSGTIVITDEPIMTHHNNSTSQFPLPLTLSILHSIGFDKCIITLALITISYKHSKYSLCSTQLSLPAPPTTKCWQLLFFLLSPQVCFFQNVMQLELFSRQPFQIDILQLVISL